MIKDDDKAIPNEPYVHVSGYKLSWQQAEIKDL